MRECSNRGALKQSLETVQPQSRVPMEFTSLEVDLFRYGIILVRIRLVDIGQLLMKDTILVSFKTCLSYLELEVLAATTDLEEYSRDDVLRESKD